MKEHYFTYQYSFEYETDEELEKKMEALDCLLPSDKQLEDIGVECHCPD